MLRWLRLFVKVMYVLVYVNLKSKREISEIYPLSRARSFAIIKYHLAGEGWGEGMETSRQPSPQPSLAKSVVIPAKLLARERE